MKGRAEWSRREGNFAIREHFCQLTAPPSPVFQGIVCILDGRRKNVGRSLSFMEKSQIWWRRMSITGLQKTPQTFAESSLSLDTVMTGLPPTLLSLKKVLESPPESCTVAHLHLRPPWRTASRKKISLRINNVLHYHLKYFKFRFNLQLIGSVETWIFNFLFILNTLRICSVLIDEFSCAECKTTLTRQCCFSLSSWSAVNPECAS